MRQRMLAVPQAYAGRLVGLADAHEASQILRAAMIECLDELKDLPAKVTDASWLERVAEEQAAGGGEPVAESPRAGTARKNLGKQARAEVARADANEGGRGKRVDNINRITSDGTSAFYLLRRLARRAPEILERFERGEFKSVRAAARAAGIYRLRSEAHLIRKRLSEQAPQSRSVLQQLEDGDRFRRVWKANMHRPARFTVPTSSVSLAGQPEGHSRGTNEKGLNCASAQ